MWRHVTMLVLVLSGTVPAIAAGDPARDLPDKRFMVETGEGGVVNVGIDVAQFGYGLIAPSRLVPGGGDLPAYRIETLADAKGVTIVAVARLNAHVSIGVDEWRITSALIASAVSSDSNLSFECQGNSDAGATLTFVYYDNQPKGRPVRKVAAAFALDRRTGQVKSLGLKPQPACKATEDPL